MNINRLHTRRCLDVQRFCLLLTSSLSYSFRLLESRFPQGLSDKSGSDANARVLFGVDYDKLQTVLTLARRATQLGPACFTRLVPGWLSTPDDEEKVVSFRCSPRVMLSTMPRNDDYRSVGEATRAQCRTVCIDTRGNHRRI